MEEFQKTILCCPEVCIDIFVFLKNIAMWLKKIGQSDDNCPALGERMVKAFFEFAFDRL